jgi:predicted DsbA family dithiol-disulfide isomerase
MNAVDIQITSDFICPWCWIGHRNLKQALDARLAQVRVTLAYRAFELNPDMPALGMDRRAYRTAKFGTWERAQERDAEVTAAGARVGLDFRFDSIAVTPNTRNAHRLVEYAKTAGDTDRVARLHESLFAAYFTHGQHIGLVDVLSDLAAQAGLDRDAARAWLDSEAGDAEVSASEMHAELEGVRAVPTVRIGRTYIQGAQPVSMFANALDNELTLSVAHKG